MRRSIQRTINCSLACTAIVSVLVLTTTGCSREQQPATPAATATTPAAAPIAVTPAMPELKDVVESTSDYIIGVSYPPVASQYPALAAELRRYADAARADLMQALQGRGKSEGASLYELSLPFAQLHASSSIVAVGVDGSIYTGGAHSAPLIARWLWLPQGNRLLTAQDLVPEAGGWEAISLLVREQLHTALSQRVDADELPPGERVAVLKDANKLIDDGTTPDPQHFSQFEPVIGTDGKLVALRFVFAPYQVGPYSDGIQTVQVPAAALLPHVAPAYRSLFQGG